MVERSIKEVAAEVKGTLDLKELSINLKGKDRKIVEFFSNLEESIFGNTFPTTKPFEIQDDAKEEDFIGIFVEATGILLERISDLEAQVLEVKEEHQLAKIEKRTPGKNISDIPELSGADVKIAHDDLEQVASYAYGLLFEYTLAGLLTEGQLEKSGLGLKTIDAIRETLRKKEEDKFEKWRSALETNHPFLVDLKEFIGRSIEDEDLETSLQALKIALTNSRTTLTLEDRGKQGNYLDSEYWSPAEKKMEELAVNLNVYKNFTQEVDTLDRFIGIIPDVGQQIQDLKKDWFFNKYSELTNELKTRKKLLQDEWTRLEKLGVLRERISTDPKANEINASLRDIKSRYKDAIDRLDSYIKDSETPPVKFMSREEIAQELLDKDWDPFKYGDLNSEPESRMKDVIIAYRAFAFGKESNPKDEIDRIVQKTKIQLIKWENRATHEQGAASVNRGMMEEQIKDRQILRSDLMVASIYHPEWGEQVRQILEYITKVPVLRPGEKLVERAGKLVLLPSGAPMQPGDIVKTDDLGNVFEYNPNLTYDVLADVNGRGFLQDQINEKFPDAHEMAKFFASKLFTTMDMLSVCLMERQLKTQTRGHNGTIEGKDYVALWKPEAAYVHRSERNGGTTADWMGWWLYYLPDIEDDSLLGRSVTADEIARGIRTYDAQYLRSKQKLIKGHQSAFFDGSGSEGEIDPVGFGESYFPHTYEALILHEGEYLEVGGKVIDWQGNDAPTNQEQSLHDYNHYFIAESGWEKILELVYKNIGSNLTYDQILEETAEGGKGGILGQFLDNASKAKMFEGEHLKRTLKPLLLHFIRRIFSNYRGRGEQAEVRLFDGVIQALEDSKSGGLSGFKTQIEEIIVELKKPPLLYGKMSMSLQKRDSGNRAEQTKEYMGDWYRHELNKEPPANILGYGVVIEGNPQKENYLKVVRNDPGGHIPDPLTRQGDLIQKKE